MNMASHISRNVFFRRTMPAPSWNGAKDSGHPGKKSCQWVSMTASKSYGNSIYITARQGSVQNTLMYGRSFIKHRHCSALAMRFALPCLLLLPLIASGGCTRTSDGSIVMAEPALPSYRPWWNRTPPDPQPAPAAFPPEPTLTPAPIATQPVRHVSTPARPSSQAGKAAKRFSGMRVGVRAPFTPSESGKPLNCANKTQPGGRVKVVCE